MKDYFPIAAIPIGYRYLKLKNTRVSMDFKQIRYFLAVAKTLNFTRAAQNCAVSQPALSKAIQNLEENLGSNLFQRNSQNVELTDFGKTMRIHFEHIDDNLQKARKAADNANKPLSGKLNIGVMCTIGPLWFVSLLRGFAMEHKDIEVLLHDITAIAMPELLLSGALDCIFCASDSQFDGRFNVDKLLEEEMVVAFADDHRFTEFDGVSLENIADEAYLDRLHCEFRDGFLSYTKARGLELDVALSSEREDWIIELIRGGMGVSVLPMSTAKQNAMNYRSIEDLSDLRNLKLISIDDEHQNPALSQFRNVVLSANLSTDQF